MGISYEAAKKMLPATDPQYSVTYDYGDAWAFDTRPAGEGTCIVVMKSTGQCLPMFAYVMLSKQPRSKPQKVDFATGQPKKTATKTTKAKTKK